MKNILIVFFVGILTVANAVSLLELVKEEWAAFKTQHRKNYNSDIEEQLRIKIFVENKHKIAKHNQLFSLGNVTYKMRLNKYSDMLHNEFIATLNGYNKSLSSNHLMKQSKSSSITFIEPANIQLPNTIDWRKKGAVTSIKDQGHCGSCWSFSATGSLEGQHFRKTGKLISLSEQNLIDCSSQYGNQGCNGGLMDQAFQYINDNGGIDTEKTYPYEGINDACRYEKENSGATDKGFVDIPVGNEDKLKAAVGTIGPVSVAIDASHSSFQFYSDGVYNEPDCDSQQLDHGVLVVGYGTDKNNQDYWLVKNSWGTTWGDSGYIKMSRNNDNQCGIATAASYPLV